MDPFYMLDLDKQQRMLGNICLLQVTNTPTVITFLSDRTVGYITSQVYQSYKPRSEQCGCI